ncbi:MAG: aminotransferase class IV, partial [Pseudomonadota bacterium]
MSDPTHVQYWINGEPATAWPCDDRGLLYGDGVFESMAVLDGHVRSLERHLARLTRGCRALGFEPPAEQDLQSDLEAMASALGVSRRQCLRLTVTRGRGARGYAPPEDPTPARLWALAAWPEVQSEWQAQGLAVTWLDVTLAHQPM